MQTTQAQKFVSELMRLKADPRGIKIHNDIRMHMLHAGSRLHDIACAFLPHPPHVTKYLEVEPIKALNMILENCLKYGVLFAGEATGHMYPDVRNLLIVEGGQTAYTTSTRPLTPADKLLLLT